MRYVGDPVALVVAETLAQAKDAAELVAIDYEPLPSVTATAEAVGGARGLGRVPRQRLQRVRGRATGRPPTPPSRGAARVVRRRYVITRVHAQYMEPRGALGV